MRSTGKTDEVLYVSLDDLFFSANSLVEFAGEFVKRGGKYLFLDEVHKYRNWSQEIKSSLDYFPELHMVVTGSSALDIFRGKADLSRRAVLYRMNGLSFREFIELKYGTNFPVLSLGTILTNPSQAVHSILQKIKPIKLFEKYVRWGSIRFFLKGKRNIPSGSGRSSTTCWMWICHQLKTLILTLFTTCESCYPCFRKSYP